MKMAYWNVNMGSGSYEDKLGTYSNWVKTNNPDLLFLEEVSFALLNGTGGRMAPLIDYTRDKDGQPYYLINYVNTLDVNLEPSTKCIAALCNRALYEGCSPAATVLRMPDGLQKRAVLKVTSAKWGGGAFWGLHANASMTGGTNAVDAAANYASQYQGNFFGGDFNYPIGAAITRSASKSAAFAAPLGWDGAPLAFTQWASSEGYTQKGTYKNNRVLYKSFEPHGVIDYLVCPSANAGSVKLTPNCTESQWSDILVYFDHCPVAYMIV